MNNQFSQKFSDILTFSKEEAVRLNNDYIGPEHLLLGIFRYGDCRSVELLRDCFHINLLNVKSEIEGKIRNIGSFSYLPSDITLNEQSARIIKISILEARRMNSETVNDEHLLLAIMKEKNNIASNVLEENDIKYKLIVQELNNRENKSINNGIGLDEDDEDDDAVPPNRSSQKSQKTVSDQKKDSDTPAIDTFGIDVTKNARDGLLDPVVGREKEIERIAQILSRRKKNNPVLIGEPGTGKTAIVEGLATRIVQKKVSRTLLNKRIISLDMSGIVAGTKYRGQFEERIKAIMNEVKANPDIIVFIDEIHTIIGAGNAPGTMDAANMIKPALSRGEMQCIGATTLDEYRKSIEKDGALERRFQKILVQQTTPEETLEILKNIKDRYENHHNVYYTDEALEACVKLTDRYVSDRAFPDKAIDALDEAGSRMHINNIEVPSEIIEQEKRIEQAVAKKTEAVKMQNYELAADFRDQVQRLQRELDVLKNDWESKLEENRLTVDYDKVAETVALMTGIPVQRVAQAEGIRMKGMSGILKGHVISQDKAIDTLTHAIQRSRVGLKEPNHPIGTFMFLGPTGVGKTFLAKKLAEFMFGTEDALIRFDMSEYMEKFTVSRLVGAPPGYVGYDEGGQLTEKVKRRPYSIVLLDEIEKAHPDVFNLLLQVMDEGRLTDSYGRTIDFRNTVIIMTSNVGSRQLKEFGRGVGFNALGNMTDNEVSRSVIQKALNKQFSPEFLNRIDEIITFDQLDDKAIRRIVDIEISNLNKRVENMGYKLIVEDSAKDFILKEGYDIQFGARPLKRAIQSHLEDGIAELIIDDALKEKDTIIATFDKDVNKISIRKAESENGMEVVNEEVKNDLN